MGVSEKVKKQEKELEGLLMRESHISFYDKLKNVGKNLKGNAKYWIPFSACLAGAGLVAYLGYKWYEYDQLMGSLDGAEKYLIGLEDILESGRAMLEAGVECDINALSQDSLLDPVRVVAEQVVQNYDTEETREIVQSLSDNRLLFRGNLQTILTAVSNVKEKVQAVAHDKIPYALGAMLGGVVDALGWGISTVYAIESYPGPSWKDYSASKRLLKKELKEKWPILRDNLREHPHVEQIYDFVDVARNAGVNITSSWLLEVLNTLKEFRSEKHRPAFEIITLNPKKYYDDSKIREVFDNFNSKLEREVLDRELAKNRKEGEPKEKPIYRNPFEVKFEEDKK